MSLSSTGEKLNFGQEIVFSSDDYVWTCLPFVHFLLRKLFHAQKCIIAAACSRRSSEHHILSRHIGRLGRSAEFLVYGHGQQRRAVIEATRLATIEIQTGQGESAEIDTSITEGSVTDSNSNPSMWKDKAKKWQQFVTQVCSKPAEVLYCYTPDIVSHHTNATHGTLTRY